MRTRYGAQLGAASGFEEKVFALNWIWPIGATQRGERHLADKSYERRVLRRCELTLSGREMNRLELHQSAPELLSIVGFAKPDS